MTEPARIKIRNHGRGHSYKIDGQKVEGVTTLINSGIPKPGLLNWAGDATANYAIDHWDELTPMPPSKRLAKLKHARYEDRDTAGSRGTAVHKIAEKLIADQVVDVPDELAGHVKSYVRFLDEWQPEVVLLESVVGHYSIRYGGRLDLVADMWNPELGRIARWLLDVKTSRSGIFGEVALQLAGYRYAEVYVDADGVEHSMADLGIERCGAIWVRGDGYDLIPVDAGEEAFMMFRHAVWLARHIDGMRDWIEPALEVPRGGVASLVAAVQA